MKYYDAIIIHFIDDDNSVHNIIVDGGDKRSPKFCYTDRLKKELELIFNKNEQIDLWVITHIDDDHIGGLYNFIEDNEFFTLHCDKLKEVWMNYGGNGDYNVRRNGEVGYKSGKELRNLLREEHVLVKEMIVAGQITNIGDAKFVVVAPSKDAYNKYIKWWNKREFGKAVSVSDGLIGGTNCDYDKKFVDFDLNSYQEDDDVKNNSSIAFLMIYQRVNLLFTADSCSSILMDGLNRFIMSGRDKLKLNFMHVPHHGSSRNSSLEFLKKIESPLFVVTGDAMNPYNLPDKETIARLMAAYPDGFELHFPQLNFCLNSIFAKETMGNMKVCDGANFNF